MPPDLRAIICQLQATGPITVDQHMGRATQKLLLDIVAGRYWRSDVLRSDFPPIDQIVHDAGNYTTSGLLHPQLIRRVRGTLKSGEAVWVRLVGLTADVSERLRVFVENPPAGVEVDGVYWVLDEVMTGGKWCASTRFTELIARQLNAPPREKFSMEFASPTTFKVRGMSMPLPIPANVFGSLKNRWEQMTGTTIHDDLLPFIDYFVMLTKHDIHTQIMRFKKRQPEVGFTGTVSYEIRKYSSYFQKQDPTLADRLEHHYDDLANWVGLLTDFAFYGGVGGKTTQGMGMVCFSN